MSILKDGKEMAETLKEQLATARTPPAGQRRALMDARLGKKKVSMSVNELLKPRHDEKGLEVQSGDLH